MITLNTFGVQNPQVYEDQLPGLSDNGQYTAAVRIRDPRRGNNHYETKYFLVDVVRVYNVFEVVFENVPNSSLEDLANGFVYLNEGREYEFEIYNCEGYLPGAKRAVFSDKLVLRTDGV